MLAKHFIAFSNKFNKFNNSELRKSDKVQSMLSILSLFCNEFNKFNNIGLRMLDSINHTT